MVTEFPTIQSYDEYLNKIGSTISYRNIVIKCCENAIASSSLEKADINMIVFVSQRFSIYQIKAAEIKQLLNIDNECYLFDVKSDDENIADVANNVLRIMKCDNSIKNTLIIKTNFSESSSIMTADTVIIKGNTLIEDIIPIYINKSDSAIESTPLENCI